MTFSAFSFHVRSFFCVFDGGGLFINSFEQTWIRMFRCYVFHKFLSKFVCPFAAILRSRSISPWSWWYSVKWVFKVNTQFAHHLQSSDMKWWSRLNRLRGTRRIHNDPFQWSRTPNIRTLSLQPSNNSHKSGQMVGFTGIVLRLWVQFSNYRCRAFKSTRVWSSDFLSLVWGSLEGYFNGFLIGDKVTVF